MAWDEFKQCAENELNFAIDSWQEVATEIAEMGKYLQDSWWGQKAIEYGGEYAARALAAIAVAVGAGEAAVAACIAIAAGAGVGIGTVLWVFGNCAGQL